MNNQTLLPILCITAFVTLIGGCAPAAPGPRHAEEISQTREPVVTVTVEAALPSVPAEPTAANIPLAPEPIEPITVIVVVRAVDEVNQVIHVENGSAFDSVAITPETVIEFQDGRASTLIGIQPEMPIQVTGTGGGGTLNAQQILILAEPRLP
jgi:hypothetical protein